MSVQIQTEVSQQERVARMGLCAMLPEGASRLQLHQKVAELGAVAVWEELQELDPRATAVDVEQMAVATQRVGARFVVPGDVEWPHQLGFERLADAHVAGLTGVPFGLWLKGRDLREVCSNAVAVMGSRACTTYGEHAAVTLAGDLGLEEIPVVSGLAYGVDAAAHRGVLAVRGTTVAVIASGIDNPYPAANSRLAERITVDGALVSEFPPGYRPSRMGFLARNRVIAALSRGTVIVEAAARSGAVNTAAWSTAIGQPVMAVPGPIHSSLSMACNQMIRRGEATLVTSASEILDVIGREQR